MTSPEFPRHAIEPVRVEAPEGLGPWMRVVLFLMMGIVFALGFLLAG